MQLLKMEHTSYLSFLHQPATHVAFFLAELRAYFHHAASISSPNYIVTIQVHFSVLQYQSNPQHWNWNQDAVQRARSIQFHTARWLVLQKVLSFHKNTLPVWKATNFCQNDAGDSGNTDCLWRLVSRQMLFYRHINNRHDEVFQNSVFR